MTPSVTTARAASAQADPPVAVPAEGAVASGTEVVLASATDGARIYYTLDGKSPTQSSTLYGGPIAVTEPVTIKARAYATGYTASAIMTAEYTISE